MTAITPPLSGVEPRAADLALTRPHLLGCRDCGQIQTIPAMAVGSVAYCRRCQAVLRRTKRDTLDRTLALMLAALILFAIACGMKLMSVSTAGIHHSADLLTGPERLEQQGVWELSAVVLFTTVGAPLLYIGSMVYVLVGIRLARPPRHLRLVFGFIERLRPWAMVEVFLLGVFVAYVKLGDLVHIEVGVAVYALCALMLTMIAADAALDPYAVWEQMERRMIPAAPSPDPVVPASSPSSAPIVACHVCGKVCRVARQEERAACPRCGSALHRRKRNAIARCWALVAASLILYVPANVYPVLTVIQLGSGAPSTILGGVEELLAGGMWPLALLVFGASIMVPVLKLIGLIFLLISTERGSKWRLRDRSVLYRIVSSIGRWSMIDIFMESILVALVQFGAIVTIDPGVGAIAFAGVVILTMFAAESFDPRLMWDAAGLNQKG